MTDGLTKPPQLPLPESLVFNPIIRVSDPPYWALEHLRPEIVRELAALRLELDKVVYEAFSRTAEKMAATMRK